MTPFLKLVSDDLVFNKKFDFVNTSIVFTNKRSIIFFKNYLANQNFDTPLLAPRFITITDLMQEIAGVELADPLFLLFSLYKSYQKIRKNDESFDQFYYWGEVILSDFDDIDKYKVNARLLFDNIADIKEISSKFDYLDEKQKEAIINFWGNFHQSRDSDEKLIFGNIWDDLHDIYEDFRSQILKENLGYEGLIFREAIEQSHDALIEKLGNNNYVFIGFNALTPCEKDLFDLLKKNGQASFYWDHDQLYSNNKLFEAGKFMSENLERYPNELDDSKFNFYHSIPKKINIYTFTTNTGQARCINQIIDKNQNLEFNVSNTAIVLADEKQLIPVLNHIPSEISGINITMGYPIRNLPIISLINSISKIWTSASRKKADDHLIYYKPLIAILKNPLLGSTDQLLRNEICNQINTRNQIWVNISELKQLALFPYVFEIPLDTTQYYEKIGSLVHYIGNQLVESENANDLINRESLYLLDTRLNRLQDILSRSNIQLEPGLWFRVFIKILNNTTIPFTGEPLSGLQVMGFLESRNLDFENLIFVSMNEGIYPKSDQSQTLIPQNLRFGYGLPGFDYRTAIYAYYFYRLIQRASNISILYNSNPATTSNSEISRFVTQIIYESPHPIKKYVLNPEISLLQYKPILIPKSESINQLISNYFAPNGKKLSPFAINTLIDCNLKFYFRYLKGLIEPDVISEEIDNRLMGLLLHNSLEVLYKEQTLKLITPEWFNSIEKNEDVIDRSIEIAFDQVFKNPENTNNKDRFIGKNLIVKYILKKYIDQVLRIDKKKKDLMIVAMESKLECSLNVDFQDEHKQVNLMGFADRIDQIGNTTRIIDYKTGKIEKKSPSLSMLFDSKQTKRNKELLQLLLYSMVYQHQNKAASLVKPVFYDVQSLFDENFDGSVSIGGNQIDDIKMVSNELQEELSKLFSNLINPAIPFSQTENEKTCFYCPYKEICGKK